MDTLKEEAESANSREQSFLEAFCRAAPLLLPSSLATHAHAHTLASLLLLLLLHSRVILTASPFPQFPALSLLFPFSFSVGSAKHPARCTDLTAID